MSIKVAILCNRSLFASGIASRLRECTEDMEIETLDSSYFEAIDTFSKAKPDIIIMDSDTGPLNRADRIGQIITGFESVVILEVSASKKDVRIYTCQQQYAASVEKLMHTIHNMYFQGQLPITPVDTSQEFLRG